MTKWFAAVIVLATLACPPRGRAEEVEIFRASTAGEKAWAWETAQVKQQGDKLLVRLRNPQGSSGNAYIADRFPWLPNARVELTVAEVLHGEYTFQALGFSNNTHVATADLVTRSVDVGRKQFLLKEVDLPKGMDQVLFKIWVGGPKDASIVLNDLVLSLPLDGSTVKLDEKFKATSSWANESLVLNLASEGAVFSLKPGTTYGSARYLETLPKEEGLRLLWNILRIDHGNATLQLLAFDKDGKHLKSFDLIKNASAGWHCTTLNPSTWPAETATFQLKLWVGGDPSVQARFGRLLILKPAP